MYAGKQADSTLEQGAAAADTSALAFLKASYLLVRPSIHVSMHALVSSRLSRLVSSLVYRQAGRQTDRQTDSALEQGTSIAVTSGTRFSQSHLPARPSIRVSMHSCIIHKLI